MKAAATQMRRIIATVLLLPPLLLLSPPLLAEPDSAAPRHSGLSAAQLGLIINIDDPYSVAIGEYYRQQRNIPATNILQVRLPRGVASIDRHQFAPINAAIDTWLPEQVQVLAVAWTNPSRVECNSMTSALARGFMAAPCDADRSRTQGRNPTCGLIAPSPYYDSSSTQPYTDFKMRPAMMLAAPTLAAGKALIDRGIAADDSQPRGSAYIMQTSDSTRSLRARLLRPQQLGRKISAAVDVKIVAQDQISDTRDALFYFQGRTRVDEIDSNRFPAGAIADNLTSFGGMLTDPAGRQMSALDFIAGGATGTFGTVSEPCAQRLKFPDPAIVIAHYSAGETLIEAYWKSVQVTFQGLFVGEPLANPWQRRSDKNSMSDSERPQNTAPTRDSSAPI